tara:strand:+ start:123 stop:404 length:282 start_codon:yes stop_codon:yes gene_type:complete
MTGQREAFWDRRLAKSQRELKKIANILKKHEDDPAMVKKKIKKNKKYFRSVLGELDRIDGTLYNVSEQTHEVNVNQGTEASGVDDPDGESAEA